MSIGFDRVELRVKNVSVWSSDPAGELHYEGLKSSVQYVEDQLENDGLLNAGGFAMQRGYQMVVQRVHVQRR